MLKSGMITTVRCFVPEKTVSTSKRNEHGNKDFKLVSFELFGFEKPHSERNRATIKALQCFDKLGSLDVEKEGECRSDCHPFLFESF